MGARGGGQIQWSNLTADVARTRAQEAREEADWAAFACSSRQTRKGSQKQHQTQVLAPALPDNRVELLKYLRNAQAPNRYLGSFTTFAADHIDDPWMKNVIKSNIELFFQRHLVPTAKRDLPVHFVGSVASAFEAVLTELSEAYELTLGHITKDPLQGLIEFHRKDT